MARFVSISLVIIVISNMFAFAQKYEPVSMCKFIEESASSTYGESPVTNSADQTLAASLHIYNSANSNYLTVELLGVSRAIPFQVINSQGEEMYSGTISGMQLVETESWPAGTYYFICGPKRETIYVTR